MIISIKKLLLRKKNLTTASVAKQRLQVIINKQNIKNTISDYYLLQLKNDLLQVVCKYMHEPKILSIHLKQKDSNTSILEFNVLFYNKKV